MNKDQVIEVIKTSINQNVITREEVINIAKDGGRNEQIGGEKESNIPKVLYSIGGVIAVTGILVLLGNNWDTIGFIGRWLATVGLGLATFVGAFMVYKKPEYNVLTQVFFIIASISSLIGGFVWLGESGLSYWDGPDSALLIASILFVIFTTALYATRKSILHIIATVFFTIAYYALVSKLLKGSGFGLTTLKDIVVYASMILAMAYLMYGSWIQKSTNPLGLVPPLFPRLYTFCAFALFLFSGLFLGGIWNLLYAFIAIGSVILSLRLQTKIGLFVTAIAIGVYCIKISIEYFADSISFSLALLFAGLLIIALGYLTYYLNKKYLAK